MNNFIFKSPKRLIKNSSYTNDNLMDKLLVMQNQLRLLRTDNASMNGKLDRILVDKHLQMQVDEYFSDHDEPEDTTHDGT